MLVRTILQHKGDRVERIHGTATMAEAARLLSEHGIGALVVTAGDELEGILSERDIVRSLAVEGPSVLDEALRRFMTTDVTTCAPGDGIEQVMATMTERRVRHLPVVDDGALVGIVSIGDVVKHRVDELQTEARTLHDYIETGR